MTGSIPNCIPHVAGREKEYLSECVDTGWLSSAGPFVDRFEKEFAAYHGRPSAVAVSSGTAAIHLGLLALGVKPGDLVICPTLTFVATINAIRYCGAEPVYIGSAPDSLEMDTDALQSFLLAEVEGQSGNAVHKASGRRVSAIVVVHLFGFAARLDTLLALARESGLPVLEDAAESLGTRHQGHLVGTIGDVGCFSFNGNKIITSGGGGMILAKDPEHLRQCKHLSTQAKSDDFEFLHDQTGFNYRMSNLCAAVGIAQFEHLDAFIECKRENAERYKAGFQASPHIDVVDERSGDVSTFWMVLGCLRDREVRQDLIVQLRELVSEGIGVRPLWRPMHELPINSGKEIYCGGHCEEALYQTMFCLPSSVGLADGDIDAVVRAIGAAL